MTDYKSRLLYSEENSKAPIVGGAIETFQDLFFQILSQKPAVRTFALRAGFTALLAAFSAVVIWGFTGLSSYLSGSSSVVFSIGTFFALVSLSIGMLFFLYSLKYYLTIAIVLSFSRRMEGKYSSSKEAIGVGLYPDISNVKIDRQPYISVHVALYNEKRVVERLLTALTSFEYENYEVIIADDSTDETYDLLLKWKDHPRVKISHRQTREGFKGGALKQALKITDQRAEFIVVFDADFIPYPDTLTSFLKYFKSSAGTLKPPIYKKSKIAAVQGYQWHVLNKSENWVTRGVRSEYAGSYVLERSGIEIYGGLKQIAGSVYMVRKDVLENMGWGKSITEDFELTLRLYEKGFKVVYTPYVQAPAEAVSTIRRLIRQRMRWAEGHSFNIKRMFKRLLFGHWEDQLSVLGQQFSGSSQSVNQLTGQPTTDQPETDNRKQRTDNRVFVPSLLSFSEKFEFVYLAPYYLQAFFFVVGTFCWFMAEAVFRVRLPFWTAIWGWSLILTNLLALPLMNLIALFLEEAEEKDYLGLASFIVLSYIVAPFQAYAAIKGFVEPQEGPWFRTPKTGRITDTFVPGRFYRYIRGIFGSEKQKAHPALAYSSSNNTFDNFKIKRKTVRWIGNLSLIVLLFTTMSLASLAPFIPQATNKVQASERNFAQLKNSTVSKKEAINKIEEPDREIKEPLALIFKAKNNKNLEYIFHPEPRVRTKFDGRQIEMKVSDSDGLGVAAVKNSRKTHGAYFYEEVLRDTDLRLTVNENELKEEFILKKYADFSSINYDLKVVGLKVIQRDDEIYFYDEGSEKWLFSFQMPYMYEEQNPNDKNYGLTYELSETTFGWKLKKRLTEEGRRWLADPARVYPVIIDPTQATSVIQGAVTTTESNYGSPTRNIAFFPNATGGAAWYAVYGDGGAIVVEKCILSSACDNQPSSEWAVIDSNLDSAADTDNLTPSIYKSGDTLYATWFDNSADTFQFNTLNTTNDSSGTSCNGGTDGGTIATGIASIAVAADGDVFVALSEIGGTNDFEQVFKIASGCGTQTSIITNSGFDQNDRPEMLTIGNNAFLVFVADNGLRLSVYVDDASPGWDTADADVNGATADNTTTDMSAVSDGTDLWIIQRNGTSGNSESFRCGACPTTSQTFTDIAEPWGSGLSTTSFVGLGYISDTNTLLAAMMSGSGTSEVVNFKVSDADSISWDSTNRTFGFAAGTSGLDDLALTSNVVSDTQVAATVNEATNSEFEFSTLPERILILLLALPFLPKLLERFKKKRKFLLE